MTGALFGVFPLLALLPAATVCWLSREFWMPPLLLFAAAPRCLYICEFSPCVCHAALTAEAIPLIQWRFHPYNFTFKFIKNAL